MFGIERGKRGSQTECACRRSHNGNRELTSKQNANERLNKAAEHSASEIEDEKVFPPQHLLHLAAKDVNGQAIEEKVAQPGVHELEGEQLP